MSRASRKGSKSQGFAPTIHFSAHGSGSEDESAEDISVQGWRKRGSQGASESTPPSAPPPRPSALPRQSGTEKKRPERPTPPIPINAPPGRARPPVPPRPSILPSSKNPGDQKLSTTTASGDQAVEERQPLLRASPAVSPPTKRQEWTSNPDSGEASSVGGQSSVDKEATLSGRAPSPLLGDDWLMCESHFDDYPAESDLLSGKESLSSSPTTKPSWQAGKRRPSNSSSVVVDNRQGDDLAFAAIARAKENAWRARELDFPPMRNVIRRSSEVPDGPPSSESKILRLDDGFLEDALPLPGGGLFRLHLLSSLLLFLFLTLNVSDLLLGVAMGAYATFLAGCFVLYNIFLVVEKDLEPEVDFEELHAACERRKPQLPGDAITLMQPAAILEDWFSMAYSYDSATHHPRLTRPVFLRLRGTQLQIGHLAADVDFQSLSRFSSCSDEDSDNEASESFAHKAIGERRTLSLLCSQVHLLPVGLNKRQRWSKKFPLCLVVDPSQQFDELTSATEPDDPVVFYLFARTGRTKQEWHSRLRLASDPALAASELASVPRDHAAFARYMDRLLPHLTRQRAAKYSLERNDALTTGKDVIAIAASSQAASTDVQGKSAPTPPDGTNGENKPVVVDPSRRFGKLLWFNAALARLFYDAWREPKWTDKLKSRWQRKLLRLRTPSYVRQLELTDLKLGNALPVVQVVHPPRVDGRGLWIDVRIHYLGGFQVTMETNLTLHPVMDDLSSGGVSAPTSDHRPEGGGVSGQVSLGQLDDDEDSDIDSGVDDDDAELSETPSSTSLFMTLEKKVSNLHHLSQGAVPHLSDSSSSAPAQPPSSTAPSASTSTGSKLKRFAGFLAQTRLGQEIINSNMVKKLSERVSATALVLTLDVKSLSGEMTINFPPAPSGVIWYGFKYRPKLRLTALPRVGQREVKYQHLTDWIERRLEKEFMKRLVLPNMEDIAIPLMSSGMDEDGMDELRRASGMTS